MNKKILYLLLVSNIVTVVALLLHLPYILMKYNHFVTPVLDCDQIGFSYAARHEVGMKKLDQYFEKNPEPKTMPEEIRNLLIQADAIQERTKQIQDICSQEL